MKTPITERNRILALDTGSKRVGLALWNPDAGLSSTLPTLHRKTIAKDLEQLERIIRENNVDSILIGYPESLGGQKTPSTETAIFWKEQIEAKFPDLPVEFHDEALSSMDAESLLKQLSSKKKKEKIDSVAAALFLEEFIRAKKEKN